MWRLTRVPFYFLISSDLDIRGEGGPGPGQASAARSVTPGRVPAETVRQGERG